MSDYNLGTARGRVEIDSSGAREGAQESERAVEGLTGRWEKARGALDKVSKTAGLAGAGIAAGLGLAVKTAADFEKGLSGIQAVSGATTQEMDQVRKKALQLGADTAFSASDASQAIEELVKAGISIPDVMNGAADATVALAAAGGIELPEAATIASNAMNQFGLTADQLPGIVDKIAGAANVSAIDVGDLGQAMQQAGAVANLAGLSFDDTAVAIAAMGNAGIKGSDAGTSLKSMLQRLQPTTKAQTTLMKNLGIITKDGSNAFFDASGKIKSMADIAQVLQDSLKGMSEQQKTATLQTLFGADAIRAAAVIAGEGAEGINEMAASMGKMKAADVAATRMNNLSGQIEQMKGSAETVAIQLGSILIPYLTKLVGKVTELVNWFSNLDEDTQKTIVTVAAVTAGVLLFVAALVKTVLAIETTVKTMKTLAVAMNIGPAAAAAKLAVTNFVAGLTSSQAAASAFTGRMGTLGGVIRKTALAVKAFTLSLLTNPVFLIIAAIVALVVALVVLYKKNETVRNFIDAAWAKIKDAIGAVVDWLVGTAWPIIQSVWNGIIAGAQAIWSAMKTTWNAIASVISTVFTVIYTIISTYINIYITIITTALNVIKAVWNAVWNTFGPLLKAVWDLIVAIIQLAIAVVVLAIKVALALIMAVWKATWNAVKAVASAVWGAISAVIGAAVNRIKSIVTTVFNAVKSFVTSVFNAIKSFVTSVWNAIYSAISGPINKAKSVVSSVANSIKSAISTAFNAAKSIASKAFSALYDAVSTQMRKAYDKVRGIVSDIRGYFSGAAGWLLSAGRNIIQGLINGITEKIRKVTDLLHDLTNKIKNAKGPEKVDKVLLEENGEQIIGSLIAGFQKQIPNALKLLSNLTVAIPESVPTAATTSVLTNLSSGVVSAPPTPPSQPGGSPLIGTQYVYYPKSEPASQAAARQATRAALLGGPS